MPKTRRPGEWTLGNARNVQSSTLGTCSNDVGAAAGAAVVVLVAAIDAAARHAHMREELSVVEQSRAVDDPVV